jgi:hypothetical protein
MPTPMHTKVISPPMALKGTLMAKFWLGAPDGSVASRSDRKCSRHATGAQCRRSMRNASSIATAGLWSSINEWRPDRNRAHPPIPDSFGLEAGARNPRRRSAADFAQPEYFKIPPDSIEVEMRSRDGTYRLSYLRPHSALIPAALMIGHHFSISAF